MIVKCHVEHNISCNEIEIANMFVRSEVWTRRNRKLEGACLLYMSSSSFLGQNTVSGLIHLIRELQVPCFWFVTPQNTVCMYRMNPNFVCNQGYCTI
jgi:hypothetical protein